MSSTIISWTLRDTRVALPNGNVHTHHI